MFASVQARLQLSQCSRDGRLHALVRISLSDLKALSTAHPSGNVVSTAQPARTVCENALSRPGPRSRTGLVAGRGSAVAVSGTDVVVMPASQLDPVAAGDAQRDDRDGQGQEEHRDPDGRRVAEL